MLINYFLQVQKVLAKHYCPFISGCGCFEKQQTTGHHSSESFCEYYNFKMISVHSVSLRDWVISILNHQRKWRNDSYLNMNSRAFISMTHSFYEEEFIICACLHKLNQIDYQCVSHLLTVLLKMLQIYQQTAFHGQNIIFVYLTRECTCLCLVYHHHYHPKLRIVMQGIPLMDISEPRAPMFLGHCIPQVIECHVDAY